ncbi:MAG: hypothetical protein AB7R89_28780 [Dehalococcoidia bacterium]
MAVHQLLRGPGKLGPVTANGYLVVKGDTNLEGAVVMMPNLPTSDPQVAGQLWNNVGVLTVSAG